MWWLWDCRNPFCISDLRQKESILSSFLAETPWLLSKNDDFQCWCQWHHVTERSHLVSHFNCLSVRNEMLPLMMLLAWCNKNTSANVIKWLKSHVSSHFSCLGLRNSMVLILMPLASCDANISANVALHFDYLAVVLLMMPLTFHYTDAGIICITWPNCHVTPLFWWSWPNQMVWCHWWHCWYHVKLTLASIALNDQKWYVAHCFNCLDQMNTVVLLKRQLASHDVDANAKCQTTENHYATHFNNLELINPMVLMMMPLMSCHGMLASHYQKGHVAPCFNHLHLDTKMLPLTMPSVTCNVCTGANSIIWPRIMWHLVSIVFT